MNRLGLAAPNRIRCQRAAVARPCRGSLRLRGLVVDTKTCARCGVTFSRSPNDRPRTWERRRFCSAECYWSRERLPIAERFWRFVQKSDGCWEWTGGRAGKGYGAFGIDRDHMAYAHRVSWEMHFGPIPTGLFVCHHCDNPPCVRPDHLFLGTVVDNAVDMVSKGRHRAGKPHRGESNLNAKLTEAAVRDIRTRRAAGERPIDLGREYGVTGSLITAIAARRAWKHVR